MRNAGVQRKRSERAQLGAELIDRQVEAAKARDATDQRHERVDVVRIKYGGGTERRTARQRKSHSGGIINPPAADNISRINVVPDRPHPTMNTGWSASAEGEICTASDSWT